MGNFDNAIWNRLYLEGEYIAAELPPTREDCRRWVAIYKTKPIHPLSPWKEPDYKYSLLDFELNRGLVDEYFSEEDKQNQKQFFVNSENELVDLLNLQCIELSLFTYPWKCDYPL